MKTKIALGFFLSLLTVLVAFDHPANADSYYNGQTDGSYTYRDGYWYSGNQAYSRTAYQTYVNGSAGYYYCGRYYVGTPGYYRTDYNYTLVPTVTQYAAPSYAAPAYKEDGSWKTEALKVAKARDDYYAYLDTLRALGLSPPVGQATGYGGYGYNKSYYPAAYIPLNGIYNERTQYGGYGVQATTVYGQQSLKQLSAEQYPGIDLTVQFQQMNRLAERQQQLGGEVISQFGQLVDKQGGYQARVAEIIARGAVAQAILERVDGPTKTVEKSAEFQTGPPQVIPPAKDDGGAAAAPPPKAAGNLKAEFEAAFKAECASCHDAQTKKGGFTLAVYYGLDRKTKDKVADLLVSDDATMMPRAPGGGPGKRSSARTYYLFKNN